MAVYPTFKKMPEGEKTVTVALVTSIEEATTKGGKPYVSLTLQDCEQIAVTCNDFNHTKQDVEKTIEAGKLLTVEVVTKKGSGDIIYYNLEGYKEAPAEATLNSFIKTAPIKGEDMYASILGGLKKVFPNSSLVKLVETIYEENKEKLLYWSAAKKIHHNCYSGLLYHVLRMEQAAVQLCKVYTQVNKEILMCAIALHDIGKLEELETDKSLGISDLTVKGCLFGHTLLSIKMLWKEYYKHSEQYDEEQIMQVEHCISAHHGNLDWGAITVPATMEACMLHQIDMIDSRIYQYEEQVSITEPGTMSDKVFGLGTKVYIPAK